MNDIDNLQGFAMKCEDLFLDENSTHEDLLYDNFADEWAEYEFLPNSREEYMKNYGKATYLKANAFFKIVRAIDNYVLLGGAIQEKWQTISNSEDDLIESEENRKWFSLAFHQLAHLLDYEAEVFSGKLCRLELSTSLPFHFEEVDNKEIMQSFTLDRDGNFSLSGYRVNPNGDQPIKNRAAEFKLQKRAVEEIFNALEDHFKDGYRNDDDTTDGYYDLYLYNEEDEQFTYSDSLSLEEDMRYLSNLIRENVGMEDLFAFDGNQSVDIINHITIDYERTIFDDDNDDMDPEDRSIRFVYHETLEIDRDSASLDIKRTIDDRCKMSFHYEIENEIPSLLDELSEHEVFQQVKPYPSDVVQFTDITQTYTICINYEYGEDRVIQGYFDANGLPVDYEDFANALLYMISFYRFSELLDDSYFNKMNPRVDDLIYCSVSFDDEEDRTYYYISDDYHVQEGDYVLVPVGEDNEETIAKVERVEYVSEDEVPYPVEKTKHIIRKCTLDDIDGFDFTS